MQILMTNHQKTYGLVVPDDDVEITVVGSFKKTLLLKGFDFCSKLFQVEDDPGLKDPNFEIAIAHKKDQEFYTILVRPSVFIGKAWIAVAPVLGRDE